MQATRPGHVARAPDASPSRSSIPIAALVSMTVLAACLRLYRLGDQVLLGDELFTVWAIVLHDFADLPASVGRFDHSIPITIAFELLSQVTPVHEWMLRVPVVAFGVALPALATLGAGRFVDRDTALLLGFWLAVHPLFVFYGRFVRPYGIDTVLTMAMIVALDRARTRGGRSDLVKAAVLGALASWLHLLALLTAGLAFGGALAVALADARGRNVGRAALRPAIAVAAAGVACLALTALLYLPAAQGLADHVFSGKVGDTRLPFRTIVRTLPLLAGLHGTGAGWAFAALGAGGFVLLARQLGVRACLLLVPALGQPLLVGLLEPTKVDYGPVLARYLVFVLPIWMLGASLIATRAWAAGSRRLRAWAARAPKIPESMGAPAAFAIAMGLLFAGPWSTIYAEPTSFAHSNHYQAREHLEGDANLFAWPPAWVSRPHPSALHPIYSEIDQRTPAVVEWFPSNDSHYIALARAQQLHRRPVLLIPFRDFGDGFDFEHEVESDDDFAALEPGTVVIVHRPRGAGPGRLRFDVVNQSMRARYGAPLLEDEWLLTFRVPDRPD